MKKDTTVVSEQKTIVKSLLDFFSGTLLSRISGFFRDLSMAFFFGADASIAALLVAVRFATLLRRLFGEGALLNGFIPHFEAHRKTDPKEAAKFFRDTFFSLFVVLVCLIGVIEWGLHFFPSTEILHLTRLILPGVVFICLFGVSSALLHCEKNFFITGAAPIAHNAIWIFAVWKASGLHPEQAAIQLCYAICFAFFFQWFVTLPKIARFLRTHLSWREIFQCRLFSLEMRQMVSSLSLGVLGVAATQINTAIDTVFARHASLEGPAYLNYAIHLQQLPLALFGVGVASVLLPSLSRAFQSGDRFRGIQLVEFVISKSMLALIPCTFVIFVMGGASVNLIYGRGHFTHEALLHTTQCLWGYGIGLVPMALALLLAPIFYAKKDYRTPTLCSLAALAVNFIFNAVFVLWFRLPPASLAYSTSLAAAVNVWLLYRKLNLEASDSLKHSLNTTWTCSMFAGLVAGGIRNVFFSDPMVATRFTEQLFCFLALFGSFVITFFLAALVFKRKEIFTFLAPKR